MGSSYFIIIIIINTRARVCVTTLLYFKHYTRLKNVK